MAQPPLCPYCGAAAYRLVDERWLICTQCEHEFDLRHNLCPRCGNLNLDTAVVCAHCQSLLPKDTVTRLIESQAKDRRQWRQELVTVSGRQRKEEEQASQERMQAYWAEEQKRRENTARALAERQQRERRTLSIVGIVGLLLILALIAAAILYTRLNQPSTAENRLPLGQEMGTGTPSLASSRAGPCESQKSAVPCPGSLWPWPAPGTRQTAAV